MDYQEKIIIKGRLYNWYSYPKKIKRLDYEIEAVQVKIDNIKSIQFDRLIVDSPTTSNDRIYDLIDKKDELLAKKQELLKEYQAETKKLNLTCLTDEEAKILNAVLKYTSYRKAGFKLGYDKSMISRKIDKIFEKIIQ